MLKRQVVLIAAGVVGASALATPLAMAWASESATEPAPSEKALLETYCPLIDLNAVLDILSLSQPPAPDQVTDGNCEVTLPPEAPSGAPSIAPAAIPAAVPAELPLAAPTIPAPAVELAQAPSEDFDSDDQPVPSETAEEPPNDATEVAPECTEAPASTEPAPQAPSTTEASAQAPAPPSPDTPSADRADAPATDTTESPSTSADPQTCETAEPATPSDEAAPSASAEPTETAPAPETGN